MQVRSRAMAWRMRVTSLNEEGDPAIDASFKSPLGVKEALINQAMTALAGIALQGSLAACSTEPDEEHAKSLPAASADGPASDADIGLSFMTSCKRLPCSSRTMPGSSSSSLRVLLPLAQLEDWPRSSRRGTRRTDDDDQHRRHSHRLPAPHRGAHHPEVTHE